MSCECLEDILSVLRLSRKCLSGIFRLSGKRFEGIWRMYAYNLLTQTDFGLQIFDMYGKYRLGQYRSGLFMSGHVRTKYLLPNIFGSKIIMDPKYFG